MKEDRHQVRKAPHAGNLPENAANDLAQPAWVTVTCADGGATQAIPQLPNGGIAECHGCDRGLARHSEGGNTIALASAIVTSRFSHRRSFWPSTLSDVVMRALAFDLPGRLPVGMVLFPGEPKPVAARSIDVAFEQIGAGPDAKVSMDAIWKRTHREHIEIPIPNLDSAGVARRDEPRDRDSR